MRRKYFYITLVLIIVAAGGLLAQKGYVTNSQTASVSSALEHKVALVGSGPVIGSVFETFQTELESLVSESGGSVRYYTHIVPYSDLNIERAITQIKETGVDLVVTGQSELAIAKRLLPPEMPILVILSADPVGRGDAKSLNGSGSNVAFVDTSNIILAPERLRLFSELLPSVKKVVILRGDPDKLSGENSFAIDELNKVAEDKGIVLTDKKFSTRNELNDFMLSSELSKYDAIFRFPGSFMASNFDLLLAFRAMNRKPIVTANSNEVERGGTFYYGTSFDEVARVGASLAGEILIRDVYPGRLRIGRPARLHVVVNEAGLKSINLAVPETFKSKINTLIK